MQGKNYQVQLTVQATAHEVFTKINAVHTWWTDDMTGNAQNTGDIFIVRFDDIHISTQKIIEMVPDQKIVWLVTESKLNFIQNGNEWAGTKICFEIRPNGTTTEIQFTHFGLIPEIECYNACSGGWDYFIKGSLYKLLTTGKGTPGLM